MISNRPVTQCRLTDMPFKNLCKILVVISVFCTTSALAQNDSDASIKVGEAQLFPSLRIEAGQTDNAFRRDENEVENAYTAVQPSLVWKADRRNTFLEFRYDGDYRLNDEDEFDFADHFAGGEFSTEFSRRSRLNASIEFSLGHSDLGDDIFTLSLIHISEPTRPY